MQITKQKDLENILNGMADVLRHNGPKSTVQDKVGRFLQCAYGLFGSWKGGLNQILSGGYSVDQFWSLFEGFLNECNNGSWSQMSRHKGEIAKNKESLFSSVNSCFLQEIT